MSPYYISILYLIIIFLLYFFYYYYIFLKIFNKMNIFVRQIYVFDKYIHFMKY